MGRYDLTEKEWQAIKPHLPNKPRGVARVDDRRVLNGISGSCVRGRSGQTCRSATGLRRRSTIASIDGAKLVSGTV